MSKGKTEAELRAQIIADIEAVRLKLMSIDTATVIFNGYKELTGSVNREIAIAKLALATEGKAHQFAKTVKFGRRVIDRGDDENET